MTTSERVGVCPGHATHATLLSIVITSTHGASFTEVFLTF